MKKFLLVVLLLFVAVADVKVNASYAVTMYSLDGRKIIVNADESDAYSKVGWYYAPVVEMCSASGDNIIVYESEAEAYKKVGWVNSNDDVFIYAPDGRKVKIKQKQRQAYLNVGWYDYPVIRLYSSDERSIVVAEADVSKWNSVGWYLAPASGKTELLNMLYGTWIDVDSIVYVGKYHTGVPFMDFHGDRCDTGWSYDYYSYGTIKSATLVGNNTYRIYEVYTNMYVDDPDCGKVFNDEYYIYYEGGRWFNVILLDGTTATWEYIGTIEDMLTF